MGGLLLLLLQRVLALSSLRWLLSCSNWVRSIVARARSLGEARWCLLDTLRRKRSLVGSCAVATCRPLLSDCWIMSLWLSKLLPAVLATICSSIVLLVVATSVTGIVRWIVVRRGGKTAKARLLVLVWLLLRVGAELVILRWLGLVAEWIVGLLLLCSSILLSTRCALMLTITTAVLVVSLSELLILGGRVS